MALLTTGLAAASSKLSKELQNPGGAAIDVIVQYKQIPTDAQHGVIKSKKGLLKHKLDLVKGAVYNIPPALLKDLDADPNVVYVSPDRPVHGMLDYANPTVNANLAKQAGFDGTGVGVAVIDSGISTSGDLKKLAYSQNFVPGSTSTMDGYGHGTHVAGIVSGSGQNSSCSTCTRSFIGMAPNTNVINLRVLDNNGVGSDSAVISAIQSAIKLKSTYNIRVINLSLGRPVYESYTLDPLCQAVESAWKAGIVVVVAAGNEGRNNSAGTDGYATITSPGNDPYVITVGAMKDMRTFSRTDDLIASYSSKGPTLLDQIAKPDLVAPGNRVISMYSNGATLVSSYPGNLVPLSYYKSNTTGTSSSYSYYTLRQC